LFLGSVLGIGLLISTLTRNQFNAAQAALNIAFLPAVMLSGFVFEIASMPQPIQWLTYVFPPRYFVHAVQTLFQAGTVWPLLVRDMAYLGATSVLFLGLTFLKTRTRLD
jgi:ABC-2 type transport system permease protein